MNGRLPPAIRPMERDDIPQVVAIDQLSFPLPWSATAYEYELTQNKNSHFMVALAPPAPTAWWPRLAGWAGLRPADSPVVGYGGFWFIIDEAHISTIAVHPAWRGQGIGEQLLVAMLERALGLGAVSATLEVRVGNTTAQSLYRKYAFEVVGRRRRYYRDNGEDALLMTAGLNPALRGRLRPHRAEPDAARPDSTEAEGPQ